MMQFKGFKPEAMKKIQGALGFQGYAEDFDKYLEDNPDKKATMDSYNKKAVQMMNGGIVMGYANGGVAILQSGPPKMDTFEEFANRQPVSGLGRQSDEVLRPRYEKYVDFFNSGASEIPGMGLDNFGPGGRDPRTIFDPTRTSTGGLPPMDSPGLPPQPPQPEKGTLTGIRDVDGNYVRYGTNERVSPEEYARLKAEEDYIPPQQDPRTINTQTNTPTSTGTNAETIGQAITNRAYDPRLPQGAEVQPVGTVATANQFINPNQGQVSGDFVTPIDRAATGTAQLPTATTTNVMDASTTAAGVAAETAGNQAAQGIVSTDSRVIAQQQADSSVSGLNAAQGTGILMSNPTQRKVESGELISGAANAETASTYAEKIEAAQATPTKQATVQGQLEGLMQSFEGGNTPAWAAGALRNATAQMAARGLGASSMAGQAMVQAAMESALPIAQADASVVASFEAQNLSNRQQRAMLAAEQRAAFIGQEFDQAFQSRVANASKVSDIANMNFTAEQQVALENSNIGNTVNLANMGNRQAKIMAEASALANMDMSNLNNRQQAAVQNAQAFLQMDMSNLNNEQQTSMFNAQQRIQSLFTDQAQVNAAKQFNATSQNQTDQFFANLENATSQFNATQVNAQEQFNAGQSNTMNKFSTEIMNQRDQFNAQNRLVIDQNNATWRRQIATADTAAVNRANELNASSLLNISNTAYNDLWQYYGDTMEWAWTSADNERKRYTQIVEAQIQQDTAFQKAEYEANQASSVGWGNLIGTFLTGGFSFL